MHTPTEKTRLIVRSFASVGLPKNEIARRLGISTPTLEKYYKEEWSDGMDEANASVIDTALRMAKSGRSWAATEFWLKTRLSTLFREPKHQTENDHTIRVVYDDDQPTETAQGASDSHEGGETV